MKILKTISNFFIKKAIPSAKTLTIKVALGILDFCDFTCMLVYGWAYGVISYMTPAVGT